MTPYPPHALAAMLPPLPDNDRAELLGDIKVNGLLDEIVLQEGAVLDGVQRQDICAELGIEPRYREYAGECGGPVGFVVAKNRRRHMTVGQRAIFAARMLPLQREESAARQKSTQAKKGQKVGEKKPMEAQGVEEFLHTLQNKPKGRARDIAGKAAGVSGDSVEQAAKVVEKGTSEVIEAVQKGRVKLHRAASIVDLSPEEQVAAVTEAETKPRRDGVNRKTIPDQILRACVKFVKHCRSGAVDPAGYLREHLAAEAKREAEAAAEKRRKMEERTQARAAKMGKKKTG